MATLSPPGGAGPVIIIILIYYCKRDRASTCLGISRSSLSSFSIGGSLKWNKFLSDSRHLFMHI